MKSAMNPVLPDNKTKMPSAISQSVETMDDLAVRLNSWALEEMGFRPMGRHCLTTLPPPSVLKNLCRGQNADIWQFILCHIHSFQKVREIKRNLKLYSSEEYFPETEHETKLNALRCKRKMLIADVDAEQVKLNHLEDSIGNLQQDLITSESVRKRSMSSFFFREYEQKLSLAKQKTNNYQRRRNLLTLYRHRVEQKMAKYEEIVESMSKKLQDVKCPERSDGLLYVSRKVGFLPLEPESASQTDLSKSVQEVTEHIHKALQRASSPRFVSASEDEFCEDDQEMRQRVYQILHHHPKIAVLDTLTANAQASSTTIKNLNEDAGLLSDTCNLSSKLNTATLSLEDSVTSQEIGQTVGEMLQESQKHHVLSFLEAQRCKLLVSQLKEQQVNLESKLRAKLEMQTGNDPALLQAVLDLIQIEVDMAGYKASAEQLKQFLSTVEESTLLRNYTERDLQTKCQRSEQLAQTVEKRRELIKQLIIHNSKETDWMFSMQQELKHFQDNELLPTFTQLKDAMQKMENWVEDDLLLFQSTDVLPFQATLGKPVCNLTIYRMDSICDHLPDLCKLGSCLGYLPFQSTEKLLEAAAALLQTLSRKNSLCKWGENLMKEIDRKSDRFAKHMKAVTKKLKSHEEKQALQVLPCLKQQISDAQRTLADSSKTKQALKDWWDQPVFYELRNWKLEGQTLKWWINTWLSAVTNLQ